MREILVEPTILESSAGTVENINLQVQETVRQLYQSVELLSASWQGSDNTAFVNQIQGYQDDFQKVMALLQQYVEFLRNSARAYRQTQSELMNQASQLTN